MNLDPIFVFRVCNSRPLFSSWAVSTSANVSSTIDCEISSHSQFSNVTDIHTVKADADITSMKFKIETIFEWPSRVSIIGAMTAQSSGCMKTWPADTFLPAATNFQS